MKVEQAKQIASKAIEQFSEALERGHSETLRKYLAAMAMFHRYSLHNLLLIVSQRPDATRVAGFHTWKQFGRNVKKGAKGIMILAPVVLRKKKDETTSEEDQSKVALGFRVVYVFDQMDTEGKPLSELGSAQGAPAGYTEKLKQFIAERGIQLEYSDTIYPAQGQCSPGKIVLLPGQSAAEEYATLAHLCGDEIYVEQRSDKRAFCELPGFVRHIIFVVTHAFRQHRETQNAV